MGKKIGPEAAATAYAGDALCSGRKRLYAILPDPMMRNVWRVRQDCCELVGPFLHRFTIEEITKNEAAGVDWPTEN
ncbi:hypothetical protein D3C72_1056770 [compost metagenome]